MFGILFTILGTIPFFVKLLGFTAAGIATGKLSYFYYYLF